MQRFLQLDPSWLRSGQTTSLFASVIEKEDVKDDLGGILSDHNCLDPTIQGRGRGRVRDGSSGSGSRSRLGVGGGDGGLELLSIRIELRADGGRGEQLLGQ